jgi:glycosyltransferase involved in cell wall biosynthesis
MTLSESGTALTVIQPNYNHAKYLPIALEALLAQVRSADETIFIDDGSTDDSVAVIEAFLPRFKNARLVRNAQNQGVVRNMNLGLKLAKGAVVHFAASDDITYPSFFAKGIALLEAYPQAALFSARSDTIDGAGQSQGPLATPVPLPRPGYISPELAARLLMRDDGWFMGNASLFRREALLAAGGAPEELGAFSDGYVSRYLALKHGACFSPEVLCAWRRIEGGMAWSLASSAERSEQLAKLVERRIADAGEIFPAGYAARWRGRHLFGSHRFVLREQRRSARANGIWPYFRALAREAIMTAALFAWLRPRDFVPVVRRRLGF